jgi:hypothetical protein
MFDIGTKIIDRNEIEYIIDDIKVISNDVALFLRKTNEVNAPITKVIGVLDLKDFKRVE